MLLICTTGWVILDSRDRVLGEGEGEGDKGSEGKWKCRIEVLPSPYPTVLLILISRVICLNHISCQAATCCLTMPQVALRARNNAWCVFWRKICLFELSLVYLVSELSPLRLCCILPSASTCTDFVSTTSPKPPQIFELHHLLNSFCFFGLWPRIHSFLRPYL